jgi:hypothetical protein
MVKEWPEKNPRTTIVRVSDPAMQWHELDLRDLLATCRRELSFRERVYPRMIASGKLTETKAAKEIEGMRSVVDFMQHCLFRALTRRAG